MEPSLTRRFHTGASGSASNIKKESDIVVNLLQPCRTNISWSELQPNRTYYKDIFSWLRNVAGPLRTNAGTLKRSKETGHIGGVCRIAVAGGGVCQMIGHVLPPSYALGGLVQVNFLQSPEVEHPQA